MSNIRDRFALFFDEDESSAEARRKVDEARVARRNGRPVPMCVLYVRVEHRLYDRETGYRSREPQARTPRLTPRS